MQKNNLDLENVLPNDELYWNLAHTLEQQTQNSAFLNIATPSFPVISYPNEQNENVNTDNSSNSNDENNTHNDKRRKRQEGKKKSETKRRTKFKEQLDILQSLLRGQSSEETAKSNKITREYLIGSAIDEIVHLRQNLSQMQQILSSIDYAHPQVGVQQVVGTQQCQQSLTDPYNRDPYSVQDLERAFEVLYINEILRHFRGSKPPTQLLNGIKSLGDVSKQLGKAQYQLSVALLEQLFYFGFNFSVKDFSMCLSKNWEIYLAIQKKASGECIGLYHDIEAGVWILSDMSLFEYVTGNLEAAGRYYQHAKDLTKKLAHPGTTHFLLGQLVWNTRSTVSVPTARKICAILAGSLGWGIVGAVILATSLIANGQASEGVDILEYALQQFFTRSNSSHFQYFSITAVMEVYIRAGHVDKGLAMANRFTSLFDALCVEAVFGKAEMLRQKANLLIMKQYPDFIPEIHGAVMEDPSIQDIINTCQIPLKPVKVISGPLPEKKVQNQPTEDMEAVLRTAMNLAHVRGLYTIELRCAIDMVRYFLHIGRIKQAVDTVLIVKDCVSRMKGSEDAIELQKARYIISLVEGCLQ